LIQHCDETKSGRKTEVHIQCCDGIKIRNSIEQEKLKNPAQQQQQVAEADSNQDIKDAGMKTLPPAEIQYIQEPGTRASRPVINANLMVLVAWSLFYLLSRLLGY
jgi:hypothetical protein